MIPFQSLLVLAPFMLACTAAGSPLFARQGQHSYPPANQRGPAPLPAWIATYNAAVAAGRIPALPISASTGGNPVYPAGTDMQAVCSWTASHCFGRDDVVNAPAGHIGISFDDGPTPASLELYAFLKAQRQKSTHFMIGSTILSNLGVFNAAVEDDQHIAVHTWSHPYMTTLTDMEILGELGWTSQIIYDNSGLVPAFWRPPYGDADNRVRAIAREVFGLATVAWNQDTFDWCLSAQGGTSCVGAGPGTDAGLDASLRSWYTGSTSPGLIILEHEVNHRTIGGFIRTFPLLSSNGWIAQCIPDLWNAQWYLRNAAVGAGPGRSSSTTTTRSAATTTTTSGSTSSTSLVPESSSSTSTSTTESTTASVTVSLVTPTSIGITVTATTVTRTPTPSPTTAAITTAAPMSTGTSGGSNLGANVFVGGLVGLVGIALGL